MQTSDRQICIVMTFQSFVRTVESRQANSCIPRPESSRIVYTRILERDRASNLKFSLVLSYVARTSLAGCRCGARRGNARLEREERRKNREQMRYYFSSRRGIDTDNETMMRFPLRGNEFTKLFEQPAARIESGYRLFIDARDQSCGNSLRKNCRAIRLRRNYAKHSETFENRMEKSADDSFDPLRRNFVTSELLGILFVLQKN